MAHSHSGQHRQRDLGRDDAEGQRLDRAGGEVLRRAHPGEELQGPEPEEDDAQGDAQGGQPVLGHQVREPPVEPVERAAGAGRRGHRVDSFVR